MGLKKEVEIGDYVRYKESGEIVYSLHNEDRAIPSIVIEIKQIYRKKCVVYDDGAFDYYESVEPVPTLLLELE
jgi:hypothetical protein